MQKPTSQILPDPTANGTKEAQQEQYTNNLKRNVHILNAYINKFVNNCNRHFGQANKVMLQGIVNKSLLYELLTVEIHSTNYLHTRGVIIIIRIKHAYISVEYFKRSSKRV